MMPWIIIMIVILILLIILDISWASGNLIIIIIIIIIIILMTVPLTCSSQKQTQLRSQSDPRCSTQCTEQFFFSICICRHICICICILIRPKVFKTVQLFFCLYFFAIVTLSSLHCLCLSLMASPIYPQETPVQFIGDAAQLTAKTFLKQSSEENCMVLFYIKLFQGK